MKRTIAMLLVCGFAFGAPSAKDKSGKDAAATLLDRENVLEELRTPLAALSKCVRAGALQRKS